jgi:hypothetical protein
MLIALAHLHLARGRTIDAAPDSLSRFWALQRLCRRDDKLHGDGLISNVTAKSRLRPFVRRAIGSFFWQER